MKLFKCTRKCFRLDIYFKWILCGIFVGYFAYCNIIANIIVQNIMIKNIEKNSSYSLSLIDLGFYILPYIPWKNTVEICMILFIILAFVNTMIWKGISGVIKVTRRYMIVYGIILGLRTISISITILPNPYSNCKPIYYPNVLYASLLYIIGKVETCFDCLFSGHSAVITLCSFIYFYYTTHKILKYLILPFYILALCLVISTRFHYSIDVVYGALLSITLMSLYHYLLNNTIIYVKGKKPFEKKKYLFDEPLYKRLIYDFIIWIESYHIKYPDSKPDIIECTENSFILDNYSDDDIEILYPEPVIEKKSNM
jgi:hypothetical protein